jgi:hypothetical protein
MLKKTVLILVLLALLLAACSPATQAPTPIPTRSSAKPTATTAATKGSQAAATQSSNLENCTAVASLFPTPNATEAAQNSLFKPVSDEDWTLGVKEAEYTFIEYSDFQ